VCADAMEEEKRNSPAGINAASIGLAPNTDGRYFFITGSPFPILPRPRCCAILIALRIFNELADLQATRLVTYRTIRIQLAIDVATARGEYAFPQLTSGCAGAGVTGCNTRPVVIRLLCSLRRSAPHETQTSHLRLRSFRFGRYRADRRQGET